MRRIDVAERRARLARRHRIAPGERARDVVDAARSVVCLHGTDPAAIYLSALARTEDMTVADLDSALYDDRSLVKHLCMRRTLFVVPRETLGAVQAGDGPRGAGGGGGRPLPRGGGGGGPPGGGGGGGGGGGAARPARGGRPGGGGPRRSSCARRGTRTR